MRAVSKAVHSMSGHLQHASEALALSVCDSDIRRSPAGCNKCCRSVLACLRPPIDHHCSVRHSCSKVHLQLLQEHHRETWQQVQVLHKDSRHAGKHTPGQQHCGRGTHNSLLQGNLHQQLWWVCSSAHLLHSIRHTCNRNGLRQCCRLRSQLAMQPALGRLC